MTKIKKMADKIEDEIMSAKDYAECYIENKAKGDMERAKMYHEMAEQELTHAMYLHKMTVADIEELKAVYTPPQKMLEKWEKIHTEYVEQTAWIRQMLSM